jgi:DNA repair protein SbcC/Rad50
MRLEKAAWHNMGPHRDWTLDLTELDPSIKVIALVGKNGRGKSYSMESAIPGACYGAMPTQGTVPARAMAADSWQESTLVHGGERYRIKRMVNAATAKRNSEVLVTKDDGSGRFVPAYEGGTGVNLFKAWAARHLPDPDVVFASIFAAQQSEGFVKMSSGDRIGVILRVLGVAKFERMAEAARKRKSAAADQLAALGRRIADIRGGSKGVVACEADLAVATEAVAELRHAASEAEAAVAAGKERDAEVRVLTAQRDAAVRELAALRQQLEEASKQRAETEVKVRNNRAVLADAENIRKAAASVVQLEQQLRAHETALVKAQAELDALRARARDAGARAEAATVRANRARARAADAPKVQAAKDALGGLRDELAEADAQLAKHTAKLDELTSAHVAGADERASALRAGLVQVADLDPDVHYLHDARELAQGAVAADDEALAAAQQTPILVRETRERIATARAHQLAARAALDAAERLAARSAEVDSAEQELREATSEVQSLLPGAPARDEAARAEEAFVELTNAIAANQQMQAALRPLASKVAPLDNAEARLAALLPVLEQQEAEVARLETAIAALPPLAEVPGRPDLMRLEDAADRAHTALRAAEGTVSRAQAALERAREVETQVAGLEAEAAAAQTVLERASRLALDLGRDGIQSAEVDSAGPELTELINDLLHTCQGPRFTVSVETQRASADGKKTIEECNIRVIDTVAGTDKEIAEHSGGERVILGEAVSLALTMLACRRAGWDRPTLIRDESAAALDPGNARAWVAMMRRAVELTGADRLLFVSHSPEVVEMADAQIEVGAQPEPHPKRELVRFGSEEANRRLAALGEHPNVMPSRGAA